jgi:hypothetical protein
MGESATGLPRLDPHPRPSRRPGPPRPCSVDRLCLDTVLLLRPPVRPLLCLPAVPRPRAPAPPANFLEEMAEAGAEEVPRHAGVREGSGVVVAGGAASRRSGLLRRGTRLVLDGAPPESSTAADPLLRALGGVEIREGTE